MQLRRSAEAEQTKAAQLARLESRAAVAEGSLRSAEQQVAQALAELQAQRAKVRAGRKVLDVASLRPVLVASARGAVSACTVSDALALHCTYSSCTHLRRSWVTWKRGTCGRWRSYETSMPPRLLISRPDVRPRWRSWRRQRGRRRRRRRATRSAARRRLRRWTRSGPKRRQLRS